jgi:5-(carboxyamino)imidazole ribonucleotide mutase
MGSDNDKPKVAPATEILERFGVEVDVEVMSAHTTLPVIGLPLSGSALNGVDALYAIAQLPPGVPAACVAIDGAKNAGILAAQILALGDEDLAEKLAEFKAGGAK